MANERARVLVVGDADQRDMYLASDDQQRLSTFADWTFLACRDGAPADSAEWSERTSAADSV